MRGLVILFVAIVVLSMMQGQPHFAPRPTGPMPAVSIPWIRQHQRRDKAACPDDRRNPTIHTSV